MLDVKILFDPGHAVLRRASVVACQIFCIIHFQMTVLVRFDQIAFEESKHTIVSRISTLEDGFAETTI